MGIWIPGGLKGGGESPTPSIKLASWSNGTDAEVTAMLNAHYNGDINIYDYWSVGDERIVHLPTISKSYNGTQYLLKDQPEQDVSLVLMNIGGKTLKTPINGHTECAFVVMQKDCLYTLDRITTNVSYIWYQCQLQTWLNTCYYEAMPQTLRGIFKQHYNITASGPGTSTPRTTTDYFSIFAEKELFGSSGKYADTTAEESLSQFEYFTTTLNRIKYYQMGGTNVNTCRYWLRSPVKKSVSNYNNLACYCANTGDEYTLSTNTNSTSGIAPFGVI